MSSSQDELVNPQGEEHLDTTCHVHGSEVESGNNNVENVDVQVDYHSSVVSSTASSQDSTNTHSTVHSYTPHDSNDGSGGGTVHITDSIDASEIFQTFMNGGNQSSQREEKEEVVEEVESEGSQSDEDSLVNEDSEVVAELQIALKKIETSERKLEEMAKLNKENVELRGQMERKMNLLHDEFCAQQKRYDEELTSLREENVQLLKEHDSKDTSIQDLQEKHYEEVTSLLKENEQLVDERCRMETTIRELHSEKKRIDDEMESLQAQNKAAFEREMEMSKELNEVMNSFSQLRKEKLAVDERLERYLGEVVVSKNTDQLVTELQDQRQSLEQIIKQLKADNDSVCDNYKREIKKLEANFSNLQNEKLRCAEELNSQQRNVEELLEDQEKTHQQVTTTLSNVCSRLQHLEKATLQARQLKDSITYSSEDVKEERNQEKESLDIQSLVSLVEARLSEVENEVVLLVSRLLSPALGNDSTSLPPPAPSSSSNDLKISLRNFEPGDIAIFFPTPKGEYLAFNVDAPHHFLSVESKQLIGQDPHFKKLYVLGRIVMKETFTVTGKTTPSGDAHPKGVAKGVQYHALSVASVTQQLN
jgi:chromosome segregation ATPase